jgi:hypothetical protein
MSEAGGMGGPGAKNLLWRWRSNPLRRREDVAEAWLVPAVWLSVVTGGVLAGGIAAQSVDHMLTGLRTERHAVTAVLMEETPPAMSAAAAPTDYRVKAKVSWTSADGTRHTGVAKVDPQQEAGTKVTVWLDDKAQLVPEPPSVADATMQSQIVGVGVALATGGVVYGAGRLVRWRLDRKRLAGWDAEWNMVEPDWRRHTI